jgi:hypothetical protein
MVELFCALCCILYGSAPSSWLFPLCGSVGVYRKELSVAVVFKDWQIGLHRRTCLSAAPHINTYHLISLHLAAAQITSPDRLQTVEQGWEIILADGP